MVQAAPHPESLNHRTRRRMDLSQGVYDGVDEARTYFYSANWQVLEEHTDTDLDDDVDRIGQQFWGVRYIDDAVARRVDRDGDGTFTGDPDDNFFYLTDVMFGVRALVDGEGRLHTRLDYTPYGVAMHGKAADVNGDGVLNNFDITAFNAVYNGGTALRPGETGYDPDADLSGSGSMNFFDYTAFIGRYSAYASGGSNPTFNAGWIDNPEDPNGPDNSVGYGGYWFDLAGATEATSSGLYMVRHRVYDPKLGRWLQRDTLGYVDGMNQYEYVISSPIRFLDRTGHAAEEPGSGAARPIHIPEPKGIRKGLEDCQADCMRNTPVISILVNHSRADCMWACRSKYLRANFWHCTRKINSEGTTGKEYILILLANAVSSHGFLTYDLDVDNFAWTLQGEEKKGDRPSPERGFPGKDAGCTRCIRKDTELKWGKGAGKKGFDATEDEIRDCILNSNAAADYSSTGYNCNSWTKQAADGCGLTCSGVNAGQTDGPFERRTVKMR